jgi:hypothetical protein
MTHLDSITCFALLTVLFHHFLESIKVIFMQTSTSYDIYNYKLRTVRNKQKFIIRKEIHESSWVSGLKLFHRRRLFFFLLLVYTISRLTRNWLYLHIFLYLFLSRLSLSYDKIMAFSKTLYFLFEDVSS